MSIQNLHIFLFTVHMDLVWRIWLNTRHSSLVIISFIVMICVHDHVLKL